MPKKVMGAMSPQRKWIRENMEPKTSPKTLEIQEARVVESQTFLFWDSYNEGTYSVGKTKAKRERYLAKKLEARESRNETCNN